jgi:hypothetical protein
MDTLFAFAIDYNKAVCEKWGVEIKTGLDAFESNNTVVRRNLEDAMFRVGDIIEIPADKGSEQWLSLPVAKGGDPVVRPLCRVTAADGTVTARELFYGTLTKSVQNRETKQSVAVTGTIVDELRNCIMQKEGWEKLLGKKLKVTNAVEVPIIRRGWNGQPDRPTTTTVYSIDVVA